MLFALMLAKRGKALLYRRKLLPAGASFLNIANKSDAFDLEDIVLQKKAIMKMGQCVGDPKVMHHLVVRWGFRRRVAKRLIGCRKILVMRSVGATHRMSAMSKKEGFEFF